MTTLVHDVEQGVGQDCIQKCMGETVDCSIILYAADIFLMGKRSRELNKILWAIEKHSSRYGMKLNKGKCISINMGGVKNKIKFSDGQEMKQEDEATYLGGVISTKALSSKEVETIVANTLETGGNLKPSLKKRIAETHGNFRFTTQ